MPFFVVTYVHCRESGWQTHVIPHMEYLHKLMTQGTKRPSFPRAGTPHKSRLLIIQAASREAVLEELESDPFECERLTDDLTATAWFPQFGIFTDAPNAFN